MIPLWAKVWGLRILGGVGIALLCLVAGSGIPALAFSLAWGPNGLFLVAFTSGVLRLPKVLVRVHPAEPMLYKWIGVRVVKRLVASRMWPMVIGMEPMLKPVNRDQFLSSTELATNGAEVCHGATFMLAMSGSLYCGAVGWIAAAVWILVFNISLNGYPIMVQRFNRWRVHQVRARITGSVASS